MRLVDGAVAVAAVEQKAMSALAVPKRCSEATRSILAPTRRRAP